MGYGARLHLPLVVCPAEHAWGYRADPEFMLAPEYEPAETGAYGLEEMVLRYLGAFGPASVADFQKWSSLTGMAPVFQALRPRLRVFRDERKRELFDLPEAPRPPEDTCVPARFVADFDNLIISHADRTRIIADEHRPPVFGKNAVIQPTILVDGFVAGMWKVTRERKAAVVTVSPFAPLPDRAREELEQEGEHLARFLEPDTDRAEIRFAA
jgi:hypothetical protein